MDAIVRAPTAERIYLAQCPSSAGFSSASRLPLTPDSPPNFFLAPPSISATFIAAECTHTFFFVAHIFHLAFAIFSAPRYEREWRRARGKSEDEHFGVFAVR